MRAAITIRRRRRGSARALARALAALAAGFVLLVVGLRWLDPPTSAMIVQHHLAALAAGEPAPIRRPWVDWEAMGRTVPIAVVAAEDQRFPVHGGLDLDAIRDAVAERERRGRLRGASTITQQVAKNLFLWRGRSWLRKALEAPLAVLLELAWPKRRILEVYLNVAQLGPEVYGVGAAAEIHFGKPPARLTGREAALLAAVLPSPERRRPDRPSDTVRARARWIERQVRQLGGARYLDGL